MTPKEKPFRFHRLMDSELQEYRDLLIKRREDWYSIPDNLESEINIMKRRPPKEQHLILEWERENANSLEKKTFDQIMTEITSGMTGDNRKDAKYLMDQCEKYKKHEFSQEILRAVGRIIAEIIPEEIKDKFAKSMNNNSLGIEKTLEEADFQIYKKDFKKAQQIIEGLIKRIEDLGWFKNDRKSEYYSFNNLFEEILYKEKYKPDKDIRRIPENYSDVYFKYGVILVELKEYDKALIALETANKYNPINAGILFELGEIHKLKKDWFEYKNITNKCLEIVYSSQTLARCYRNYGFYFIEQKNYDMAIKLFCLSMNFDQDSKMAHSELLYISEKTGQKINFPSHDELIKSLKDHNIQLGANELVLGIAAGVAQEAHKAGNTDMAIFFLEIFYDLTNNDNAKELIDKWKNS